MLLLHHKYLTCHLNNKQTLSLLLGSMCLWKGTCCKVFFITWRRGKTTFFRFVIFLFPPPEELPRNICWHIRLACLCTNSFQLNQEGLPSTKSLHRLARYPAVSRGPVQCHLPPSRNPCFACFRAAGAVSTERRTWLLLSPVNHQSKAQLWICLCVMSGWEE